MQQKRILILGGAKNQVPLIQAAKKEGYYVAVCDWTTTNPGLPLADHHYQVSTLDREAVMKAAREANIDGVISNSEPAMVNVAYVAGELGLVGNPVSAIEILSSKKRFRDFQDEIELFAPRHTAVRRKDEFQKAVQEIGFPLIVKPSEGWSSNGTALFYSYNAPALEEAFETCIRYSRNSFVSVEQYVEMPSLTLIDGDVFVSGDNILWSGMFFSKRERIAPMVPRTQSYPLKLDKDRMSVVKNSLKKVFSGLRIIHGEYNVEMYFDASGRLFIIEINCRQGGNGIPAVIQDHCGIDMYRLLVTTAVGDNEYLKEVAAGTDVMNYVSRHPVYSSVDGIYRGMYIDSEIKDYVTAVNEVKKIGDRVERVKNAKSVVGFVSMEFPSYELKT